MNNPTSDINAKNFTFGIEIECYVPAASRVTGQGWNGHGEYHIDGIGGGYDTDGNWLEAPKGANGATFAPTSDSSLERDRPSGYNAVEFVSTILKGDEGVQYLNDFLTWLNAIGAKVNRGCGLHVHVGVDTGGLKMRGRQCAARYCENPGPLVPGKCGIHHRHLHQ